jgi:putative transposase
VLNATWQRCRVHFMRNALAHAGKSGRRVVSAFIATAFAQDDAEAAKAQWRRVADQLRPKLPKLAAFLDQAESDVLAYMTFPAQHRAKLHSTNPVRSSDALMSWASSPTRTPSSVLWERSSSNRTMNGPSSALAT